MKNFKCKSSKEKAHKWTGYKEESKETYKMTKISSTPVWWLLTLFYWISFATLNWTIWKNFLTISKSNMALLTALSSKEL